jgi:hypothetical protein
MKNLLLEPQMNTDGTTNNTDLELFFTAVDAEDGKTSNPIRHSLYAVFQMHNVEIDQQLRRFFAQLEIGKKLRLIERQHFLYSLQLHDREVFNKTIGPGTRYKTSFVVSICALLIL